MPKVIYAKDGRIGCVTLNRPEVMNAIDDDVVILDQPIAVPLCCLAIFWSPSWSALPRDDSKLVEQTEALGGARMSHTEPLPKDGSRRPRPVSRGRQARG